MSENNKLIEYTISIPDGIRYIDDWKEFDFPEGFNIFTFDKGLCGCGITTWALNNYHPVILISPRKVLLENKESQHNNLDPKYLNLRPVYYFRNNLDKSTNCDKPSGSESNNNTSSIPPTTLSTFAKDWIEATETAIKEVSDVEKVKGSLIVGRSREDIRGIKDISEEVTTTERQEYIKALKWQLKLYLQHGPKNTKGWDFVPKILVTYDSLHYVLDVLGDRINDFYVVVDEFQCLFQDSTFKPEVELSTLDVLETRVPKICFMSATPMLEKYLMELDFFRNIPIFHFDWGDRVKKINLRRVFTRSITTSVDSVINSYRSGSNAPQKIIKDAKTGEPRTYISREAVFFVNSVKTICDIILFSKLMPEEVNIICSDTKENIDKLKSLNRKFAKQGITVRDKYVIGEIPGRGDPHKMFTFCTRTTYIGTDFYSTSAMTYICSDMNINTMVIDIALDLPQIVGRQRLDENVFRDEVIFFFRGRTKRETEITREEFDKHISDKDAKTDAWLDVYNNLVDSVLCLEDNNIEDAQKKIYSLEMFLDKTKAGVALDKYQKDYGGLLRYGSGRYDFKVVKNKLVKISEERAYEITRPEYQDSISIVGGDIDETSGNFNVSTVSQTEEERKILEDFLVNYRTETANTRKLKILCSFIKDWPTIYQKYYTSLGFVSLDHRNYINILGVDRVIELNYQDYLITREIGNIKASDSKKEKIYSSFTVGETYLRSFIKDKLIEIYDECGISGVIPTCSELNNYFSLVKTKLYNSASGKREHAFRILSRK